MKRALVLSLALVFVPAMASAQVEIGMDAGFMLKSIDDASDNITSFAVPSSSNFLPMVSGARVAFSAGETVLIESLLNFAYQSFGSDDSVTFLGIIPGINFLVTESFYVRGEAGLAYAKFSSTSSDESETQYLFGGGAGYRRALGDGAAVLRLEAGVDRLLENTDDGVPASWDFRALVGLSAVIG